MIAQVTKTCLFLVLVLWLNGCMSPGQIDSSSDDSRPPNIILILADDLGIGDTGIYGSKTIKTPNIDALAGEGVRFTQGYVSHPVCSPSRAGMITGRYQQRHGWEFNPAGRDMQHGMSVREVTLAQALKARGYATGMVGKWHLGHQVQHHPLNRGFDEYFGVLAGASLFIDPKKPGVESIGELPYTRKVPYAIYDGFEEVEVEDYLTDVFTGKAISFIDKHRDEPFFLYLSHTTPHTPLQATDQYLSLYNGIEDKATRIYAAMVSSLDESVAQIVEKLRSIGQYENTLIVFLSDNGCAGYIGKACSNAPHAGFKRYHQEGGIRVPFIMSWPGQLPASTIYEKPVTSLDLFATFTAAAGQEQNTGDSVNLIPYLSGDRLDSPHEYLFWRSGPTMAIRDQRWKLIKYNKTNLTMADLGSDGRLKPPKEGWASTSPQGQVTLLYDLQNDPGEQHNLAKKHPEVVQQLKTAYDRWARELPDQPIMPAYRSTLTTMDGEIVQLIF